MLRIGFGRVNYFSADHTSTPRAYYNNIETALSTFSPSYSCCQVSGPRAALLAQVKASMRLEERTHQNEERAISHKGAAGGGSVATSDGGSVAAVFADGGSSSSSKGGENARSAANGKKKHGQSQQEQPDMSRKARRAVRVAALQALAEAKPGMDEDDPADVTAIAEAKSTIGDFKRKVRMRERECVQ